MSSFVPVKPAMRRYARRPGEARWLVNRTDMDYTARMKRIALLVLLLALVVVGASACKSHSGSREFIPGQGWQKN